MSLTARPVLPDRDTLRAAFDQAIAELDGRRGGLLSTDFYRRIGDSVFDAGYRALEDFCDTAPKARLHVVSAPVGSGKTSFSQALIASIVRTGEANSDAPSIVADATPPFGCLYVVDQMLKADELFQDLNRLLPGKVAVWTTEHDPKARTRIKVLNPAEQFTKEDLQNYPVAIVTHTFFGGKGGHKARQVLQGGQLQERALTIIDERIDEVKIFDIELSEAQRVRELIQQDEQHAEMIGPYMVELIRFMQARSFTGADIEKPGDEPEAWDVAKLQWFTTVDADYVKAHYRDPIASLVFRVFGFAKALANGYAFIARNRGGVQGTHFMGYEQKLMVNPGTVLLDATADIDGITPLCPWRKHSQTPQASYQNLLIVHVPSHTKMRLGNFFKAAKNRRAYVAWMEDTIRANMEPGQKGLVVCKKTLFENEDVPENATEVANWDIDGRQLYTTHWGTGIGSNTWRDAEVVFLFDEFFVPRRVMIASAQGLQNHRATEGDLSKMKTLNSKAPAVDLLEQGHLLRWQKQMALRGHGRCFDEHGNCGEQKLVYVGDRKRLLAHANTLYPGAKIVSQPGNSRPKTKADALLDTLSRPNLPDKLTTNWIGQQMRCSWRAISKNVMPSKDIKRAIASLGWAYVSGKGRGGSHFARLRNAEPQARMPAVPAQNDTGNDTKLLGTGCLYSGLEPVEIVGPELSSILQQEYERFLQPAIKAESKPLWITNPREPQAMLVDHEAQGAAPPTSSAREYSLRNRRWLDVHDIYDFQFRGRCPARIR